MTLMHQHSVLSPYHLSVGAVLINDREEVAAHHYGAFRGYEDFYILMRESIENDETIEQALSRGLAEEMGAKGKIICFLGSEAHESPANEGYAYQKTTLYYLLRCTEFDPAKRSPDDIESVSNIVWLPIRDLLKRMGIQRSKYNHPDIDETGILKRAQIYLSASQSKQ